MPPFVLQAIAIFQLLLKVSPVAVEVYDNICDWFKRLFAGGIITVDQQRALMDWADAHQAATLAGEVPPEFTVESDPPPPSVNG